jgi:penicillin-binding protein 1B
MAISIKKLSIFIIGLLAVVFISILVFSTYTVLTAPMEVFENTVLKEGSDSLKRDKFYLETGTVTEKAALKNYLLFSTYELGTKQWFKANASKLEVKKNKVIIKDKIEMPRPLFNECHLVYCFQKRMRFEKIPPIFWKGLIGIEDERFLLHKGIDFKSLLRAFVHDVMVMRLEQGGSTLTQQIVKNLFYTNEKKFSRKIKEMVIAVYLESKFEKDVILQAYFNEVVWGGKQGIKIKGLYSASLFYFNKKPQEVSPYEAAILISLLKGPNFYNPLGKADRLRKRADLVFEKLVRMNLFPSGTSEKWNDLNWEDWLKGLKTRQKNKPFRSNWWLSQNLEKGELGTYERYVFHNSVRKTMRRIKERLPKKDIAVKAFFGDLKKKNQNYFYYSKYERSWERAQKVEKHTLGSTIKPLIYSMLIELGTKMDSEVETGPLTVKMKSGDWKPREAHKIAEPFISLRTALKLSYNRPIIRESINRGLDNVEKEMLKVFPDLKLPLKEYPAQLLGTVEITMEELFNIYRQFIIRDCTRDKQSVVKILSDPKETTIRRLVGSEFGNLRFFGKTGTSNNGFDNWFIFYEGNRLGVIWVGLEGARAGGDLKLYGGTTSFKIFKDFYLNSGKRFGEFNCTNLELTN